MSKDPTEAFRQLREEIAELKQQLETANNDPTREKAFELLYGELRQYKEDFLFQAEKPLLLDLILFFDSLSWFRDHQLGAETSHEVLADHFQYLLDEFLEILYRRDVVPVEPVDQFDPKVHKAVRVVAARNADEDQSVRQVVKRGFRRGERALRPEEVVVARWRDTK